MEQYPFDNAGSRQWRSDYNALSESSKQSIRDSIEYNFYEWLTRTFSFTEEQIQYLTQLNPLFVTDIQLQILFALEHNLPIILEKETNETSRKIFAQSEDSVKVTELKNRATETAELPIYSGEDEDTTHMQPPEGRYSTEGEVVIRIYYRKV